jgi:serine/threonine protein kinase
MFRSRLLREAHLMMSLNHRNIIQIYGVCGDGNQMLIALERASGIIHNLKFI